MPEKKIKNKKNTADAKADNKNLLSTKQIAILGYTEQGRGHAMTLRNAGYEIVIGEEDSDRVNLADADEFKALSYRNAVESSDVIGFYLSEEEQIDVYKRDVMPFCKEGKCLLFPDGFNVNFEFIVPPPTLDVILISPMCTGRELYRINRHGSKRGFSIPVATAVMQDASGMANVLAREYACAIGAFEPAIIESTIEEETEAVMFTRQAVIGGMSSLLKSAYETLTQAGYSEELAYAAIMLETRSALDLASKEGISEMTKAFGNAAEYGILTRGSEIISPDTDEAMEKILAEIQNGEYAKEWRLENMVKRPVCRALAKALKNHPIEEKGAEYQSNSGEE